MVRTQIFVQDFELDLFPINTFEINFSIKDVQELTNKGTFTKSLSVPSTTTNDEAFGFLFDLNVINGTFNPTIKNDCLVIVDGNQILDGYCELNNIKFKNKKPYEYEFTIYGENNNIFRYINDDVFLSDLDISELDHVLTGKTISDSWTGFTSGAINYVYPFINYGKGADGWMGNFYGGANSNNTDWVSSGASGLTTPDFYPAVRTKYILDKIFSDAGLTYSSNFLNSSSFKDAIIPFCNDLSIWVSGETSTNYFSGSVVSSEYCDGYGYYLQTLIYDNEGMIVDVPAPYYIDQAGYHSTPFCILSNIIKNDYNLFTYNYSTSANYVGEYSLPNSYLIHKKGKIKIDWGVEITSIDGVDGFGTPWIFFSPTITPKSNINVAPENSMTVNQFLFAVNSRTQLADIKYTSVSTTAITGTCIVDVDRNDIVWLGKYYAHVNFHYTNAFMNICYIDDYFDGINQNFNRFFSEEDRYKQRDFISDIFKMFNLFVKPDKINSNNFIIEPYEDFYAGNIKDWTYKIDLSSKEIELLNNNNEFKFFYNDDNDYYTKKYTTDYGLTYPEFTLNTSVEFAGKKEIKLSLFSPTVLNENRERLLEDHGWLVYSDMTNGEDTPVIVPYNEYPDTKRNLRILYYNNQSLEFVTPNDWPTKVMKFNNQWVATQLNTFVGTYYPYAGHLNNTASSTLDLNFDTNENNILYQPINATYSGITNNNLYNQYYNAFLTQIGSPNSKILKAKINLSSADINQFDYSNKIYLSSEQAYFIVQSIKYTPGELSDVELIKLDDVDVDYTAYQIGLKKWAPAKPAKNVTNIVGNMILGTSLDNGLKTYGLIVGDDNIVESYEKTSVWCASTDGSYTYKAEEEMIPFSGYNFIVGTGNIVKNTNNVLIGCNNINLTGGSSNVTLIGVSQLNTGYTFNNGDIIIGNNNALVIGSGGTVTLSSNSDVFVSGSSGTQSIRANNSTGTDATANYAFATGNNNQANGLYSVAFGMNSSADGDKSFVCGDDCSASADLSIALGDTNQSNGVGSFSVGGTGLKANGQYSAVIGGSAGQADGNYAVVLGGSGITGGTANTVYGANLTNVVDGYYVAKKYIPIGTWDMTSDVSKSVYVGIAISKIININVYIKSDASDLIYPLSSPTTIGNPGNVPGGTFYYNLYVMMQRFSSGVFAFGDFANSSNRGWITIDYIAN